ncbi:uncharacterized protein LOC106152913 [Lingula anatina]|uniref:Uncharacterized protein LOC106152913 n=1 Tax=Lingula anatina TaxID=7574 RepID=A0A1S3H7L9_LINAN|nr:uncharacterized protein LOC106152913 [Lingula anatina]|eukprot:XP_013382110.1 uncharacterized protein LOC106152913 [Lingula anatina]
MLSRRHARHAELCCTNHRFIVEFSLVGCSFVILLVIVMEKDTNLYRQSLPADVRERYDEKTKEIGVDPYTVSSKDCSTDKASWQEVNLVDVIHFLIFQRSAYTKEELRNYKALEAYKFFQDGWIKDMRHIEINGSHLIKSKVHHSLRIREKPLEPWVIIKGEGSIECAHCTCMAGLGESCSHIAAMLFALETWTRIRKETTVTDVPAYWMAPSSSNLKDPFHRIVDMDLQSATKKRKTGDLRRKESTSMDDFSSPTKNEMDSFIQGYQSDVSNASILAINPEFAHTFKPKALLGQWPVDLSSLKDTNFHNSNIDDILAHTAGISIAVTEAEAAHVELHTRDQCKSTHWRKYRLGRITASQLYSAVHTDIDKPSMSVVKSVCYPQYFSSASTEWGIKKERVARKEYCKDMAPFHVDFQVERSGLLLNPDFPEFGASPDGFVSCNCCGKGLLEIKCPFTLREADSIQMTWLENTEGGLKLKKNTAYYYQVQMQLFMSNLDYCDFFVWCPYASHCERIVKDQSLWDIISVKAKLFHKQVVMPELLCGYFTMKRVLKEVVTNNCSSNSQEPKYCICNGSDDGRKMVACDNENCSTVWYHMSCIKMKRVPKGRWFCNKCRNV